MNEPAHPTQTGLCNSCIEAERTGNDRGSQFVLCALSRTDQRYPRYPRLPVVNCDGYRPAAGPETGEADDVKNK